MNYKIIKILNNNVVIAKDENDRQIIITGNGIGYGVKAGGVVSQDKIKRIYVPETKGFVHRFSALIGEIPYDCFDEAERIKEMAEEELHETLNQNLIIALADHINFAITQLKNGNPRTVLVNEEIERFYPDEFRIGRKAVHRVEERFHVQCAEAEAGAFAFHIINSETGGNSSDATRIMKTIPVCIKFIVDTMNL